LQVCRTDERQRCFNAKRSEQNEYWMLETINEQLKLNFYNNTEIQTLLVQIKRCKTVKYHHLQPLSVLENILKVKSI
jgi:LAO/AO transport system kinase